jgi:hypothetical protein
VNEQLSFAVELLEQGTGYRRLARETGMTVHKARRLVEEHNAAALPSEAVQPRTAVATAHEAVQLAESLLTAEEPRPASREHWQRLAHAYERRGAAWRLLSASWERDASGHVVRAMELAAEADLLRARMLRHRLAVTG